MAEPPRPFRVHFFGFFIPEEAIDWMHRIQPHARHLCRDISRPCPHLLCQYHLYLAARKEGDQIQIAPTCATQEIWQASEHCVLDRLERANPAVSTLNPLLCTKLQFLVDKD